MRAKHERPSAEGVGAGTGIDADSELEATHRAVLDDAHAFEESLCVVLRLLGGDPDALMNGSADSDEAYRARLVAEAELFANRASAALRELASRPTREAFEAEREERLRLEGALREARRSLSIAFALDRKLAVAVSECASLEERLASRPAPPSPVDLTRLEAVGNVKVGT